MIGKLTRTVVPEIIYREYKSLYLELRTARSSPAAPPVARGAAPPRPRASAPATKADLRAAVTTILRGEDVNAAKPGPRLTAAKRRQIEAAKEYQRTHAGCTLHNACIRSFAAAKGGFASGKALYVVLKRQLPT